MRVFSVLLCVVAASARMSVQENRRADRAAKKRFTMKCRRMPGGCGGKMAMRLWKAMQHNDDRHGPPPLPPPSDRCVLIPACAFSWDALDVTNDTACGWAKCYIKSLQGEREDEGWLVGNREWETRARTGFFRQWSRAWAFAEELRAHFGVDHLLRGPPFLATLSHVQARYLNARIQALDRQKQPKWSNPHRTVRMIQLEIGGAKQYYPAGPHPVQAVHSCSWPECMELRCEPLGFDGSLSTTAQAIKGFVANAPNKKKLFLGIKQNFSLVIAMVKAHPCLRADFQVYLRNDGVWFNIDLDRCGDHSPFSDKEKIKLAQLPGLCGKRSSQLILDEAFEQLTGELSLHVSDSGN